jgi:D-alanyl-lipoteichoic acid acyltransferase DltB (MBOAT superfamily)
MLFNSINFLIFLPIVFFLYWFIAKKSLKAQNILLLVASYFFYACWDWRFLFLLIFSTLLDYFTGLKMSQAENQKVKKFWFWLSIIVNLGFLGTFKYYNFFAASFATAISNIGFHVNPWTINVILPVGISFYTFHGLSYVIDIYNDRIKAEKNFIDYSVFVSFFPLLVAGPIERATHLLPQIQQKREFNYSKAVNGLRQILWGFFKKIVIADQCAEYANMIFNNQAGHSGLSLLMGALFFTFQIYCDFSGYSDIALGTAKLFGIDLLRNFAFPYFSRDIAEFWRRWHISLSSWFRDYLYIPLSGSKGGSWKKIRNTFIIFIVSGFWHGANWTFIAWGTLNAIYFLPLLLTNNNRNNLDIVAKGRKLPTFKESISMLSTYALTVLAWVFFRSDNFTKALLYIKSLFTGLFIKKSYLDSIIFFNKRIGFTIVVFLLLFMLIEWIGREQQFAIEKIGLTWKRPLRLLFYYAIILAIIWFSGKEQQFIYFQF